MSRLAMTRPTLIWIALATCLALASAGVFIKPWTRGEAASQTPDSVPVERDKSRPDSLQSWIEKARAADTSPCPNCGSANWIPIAYGLPGPEMMTAGDRGEILLGGCMFQYEDRYCRQCGHKWESKASWRHR